MRSPLTARPTAAKTITTLASLAVLGGVLLTNGCDEARAITVTAPSFATPGAGPTVTPTGAANSIDGLPGTLFYRRDSDDSGPAVFRIDRGGKRTPLPDDAVVSPDGRRVAWTAGESDLLVADLGATRAWRTFRHVAAGYGFRPVWSADGTQILTGVARAGEDISSSQPTPVVIRLADSKVTPLPKSLRGYLHYRWSGDGKTVVFTTGECVLKYAPVSGAPVRTVPVLGSQDSRVNPKFMRACDVVGVSTDGTRVAVDLHIGDEPDGDIAGSLVADTVIDTATGALHRLPVTGKVISLAYGPSGDLLVRSEQHGKRTLTLISPADIVLATVSEPVSLKNLELYQYTR